MIKVFDTTQDYETYSAGGLKSGELCYVAEDKTAHFRTNNIDGIDKEYDMSEGGGSEPEYTELNLSTFIESQDWRGNPQFSIMISASLGQTIEIYNPNHFNFGVGQGNYTIDPATGELSNAPSLWENIIYSYNESATSYLEHLYNQNATNGDNLYSDFGFCIMYSSNTPIDGVIYYRIID